VSGRERGQAAIELLAALPLLLAAALAAGQLLAWGAARELAGHAAGAGAAALLQDRDPRAAARAALPGWSRSRVEVAVDGRRVRVGVRPPGLVPGLARSLRAVVVADAGPRP
jgi:hypothetical protein